MTPPFPYDAVESDDAVCFVAACQAPPGRPVETALVPGRGLEMRCGRWMLRASNLHPRLELACRTKPISIAAIDEGVGLVVRGPDGIAPPLWRSAAFYWYLDPTPTTVEDLARRPFPRALAAGGRTVVVSALAAAPYGPPIGLCASSAGMSVLPPSRVWHRVSTGLLVDEAMLSMRLPAEHLADGVTTTVERIVVARPHPPARNRSTWRPQLALLASRA